MRADDLITLASSAAGALLLFSQLYRRSPARRAVRSLASTRRRLAKVWRDLAGYEPIVDPESHEVIRPAIPGLGDRVRAHDELLDQVLGTVTGVFDAVSRIEKQVTPNGGQSHTTGDRLQRIERAVGKLTEEKGASS